jgi:Fe-S cluster assembly protein SufD
MMPVAAYESTFNDLEKTLRGVGPSWVHDMRKTALGKFKEIGFPTLRDEEWRATRVKPIADMTFATADRYRPGSFRVEDLSRLTFDDAGCRRLVFVDGHFAPDLSNLGELPEGILLGSLTEVLERHPALLEPFLGKFAAVEAQAFVALNTAFVRDGAFVFLQDNIVADAPIHVVFASSANNGAVVAHPRVLVVAGRGSKLSLIESYVGEGEGVYFNNVVSEIVCGKDAEVTHCKLQREGPSAFHIATQHTHIGQNGRFSTENISMGARLVRNDVYSILAGEGIDCRVDGLYLGSRRQHIDNHTFIRHAKPNCHSFEMYKGILNGKARGVFNGKIYVDQDAQKTDAKQANNCILLSDDARISTNPQLEIFADDVKCTHGATVGQLDDNAVFYLRSRGITDELARQMLIYAFAAEVLGRISIDKVRNRLESDLYRWLSSAPNV